MIHNITLIMEEKTIENKLPVDFNPTEVFRLELTPEEAAVIATLLPQHYSLHVESLRKDSKSQNKKKTAD